MAAGHLSENDLLLLLLRLIIGLRHFFFYKNVPYEAENVLTMFLNLQNEICIIK